MHGLPVIEPVRRGHLQRFNLDSWMKFPTSTEPLVSGRPRLRKFCYGLSVRMC